MIEMPSATSLAVSFFAGGGIPIGVLALLSAWPRAQFWGDVISSGPIDRLRRTALTFDDGPDGEFTPRILDTLGEHDVRATFFVIGRNVQRYPDVIRRIAADGHVIANHTWDHDHHGYLRGARYWRAQLDRTTDAVAEIIGGRMTLFRPPMGVRTGHVMRAARETGNSVVTWSRRGFDGIATTAGQIEARLGDRTNVGDIVVLHDGVEPNSRRSPAATCAALGPILQCWKQRDIHPIRLDEWIDRPAYASSSANS